MKYFLKFILWILLVAVVCLGAYAGVFMVRFHKAEPCKESFKLASLNCFGFKRMQSAEASAGFIRYTAETKGIDILCLQEVHTYAEFKEPALKKIFSSLYPYMIVNDGEAIFSKYPLRQLYRKTFDSGGNEFSINEVTVKGKPITIVNCHLQSTGISSIRNRKSVSGAMAMGKTLESSASARNNQALEIRKYVDSAIAEGREVIIAGDFNTMPGTKTYRILKDNLEDSFLEAGYGWGATFSGILRIDHIFHSQGLQCVEFQVIPDEMSDHKSVMAKFSLDEEGSVE